MKKKRITVGVLVKAAFLTAISIVLTRGLPLITKTLRIGLGEVPLMLSGFLFGPLVGGMSGFAADISGIIINPQGPPHIGFTISSILWGMIPGLFVLLFRRLGKKKNPYTGLNVSLVVSFCILLISIGLNTYWLSRLYGRGFFILLPERLTVALINIPVQSIIISNLIKHLRKYA